MTLRRSGIFTVGVIGIVEIRKEKKKRERELALVILINALLRIYPKTREPVHISP